MWSARRGFLLAAAAGAISPALAQVDVGSSSSLRKLVPAETLESSAAQQYQQLLGQARAQRALAPAEHPQLQHLHAIARRLIPFTATWNERARQWRWEVNLIGSKQINAFCMPGPQWWLGTCIGVGGGIVMALAATDRQQLPWAGMALCLLAGLSYAAYALVNQALVLQAPVTTVNAWVFGCAACMSLPFAAWLGGPLHMTASGWAVVAYLGMVATGLTYLLFSVGLRGMSAATGVALSKAEPITAFALSLLVVGERPAWWSVIGLLGVIGGLGLVVQAERKSAETV